MIKVRRESRYFERQQGYEFTDLDDIDPKYLMAGYSPEKAVAHTAHARSFRKVAHATAAGAMCP